MTYRMTSRHLKGDSLSSRERSKRMSLIRSKGNRSTELSVETALRAVRIRGWRKHPRGILGQPDFYFPKYRLAVFVDGCFWHACPLCARRMPQTRAKFWAAKIQGNRRRDQRVRRKLVRSGIGTMRVWEHELNTHTWLERLRSRLSKQSR